MDIITLKKKVLDKYKPDSSLKKKAQAFMSLLQKSLDKQNIIAQVTLGGSLAKNTYLQNDFDADIFVRFDMRYDDAQLSQLLFQTLTSVSIPYEKVHGSRDYAQLTHESISYEIIPVCKITKPSQARNVTDMSFMHVTWVNEHTANTSLCDEIRLLKVFCKAQRIYGAESYIGGFSGHILDILVIHYGGFLEVLEASQHWKKKEVIDVQNHYNGKNIRINPSKIEMSPLIIIDPILALRNASAALTQDKYILFRKCAKAFLQNPSITFFTKSPLRITNPKGSVCKIELFPLDGKKDVVGAKLKKVVEYIRKTLVKNEFTVFDYCWEWDTKNQAVAFFDCDTTLLSKEQIIKGPPLTLTHRVESFQKVHTNTYTQNNTIYALKKRAYRDSHSCLKAILKHDYVIEKVEKIVIK